MATKITNPSIEPLSLPYPLRGTLAGKQSVVLNTTVAVVVAALGGAAWNGVSPLVAEVPNQASYPDNAMLGDAAALYAASAYGGTALPKMTTAQRDALTSPPAGLLIYNTTTNKLNVRVAAAWEVVTSA